MASSELFLLLPVYEEVEGQPDYILRIDVADVAELNKYIEEIYIIEDFLQIENYAGYYDAYNINAFLHSVRIMDECYPNVITRFRYVMNRWGENWRNEKKQEIAERYKYFCKRIQDDTLCEIAKRKCIATDDSTFLLINNNAISCPDNLIRTLCNDNVIEIDVCKPKIKDIANWFENNRRPQRIFNWNPKHGEYGKGAHPSHKGDKVSILMCSRSEANALLNKAVGIDLKVLYTFDEKYGQYIEFKRENKNIYHGFHLDMEEAKRVPPIIRERIEKLNLSGKSIR